MVDPLKLLSSIPDSLRRPLFECFKQIAKNYAEHRWEPSELNAGKLCEIAYCIIDGATSGAFVVFPKKPPNMLDACRAIEKRPADPARTGDRSLRVLIPRLLPYLYEIRNNRGVGHVGGDIDPNFADATAVFSAANWLMAELIRIFHGVGIKEAQATVDALVERKHPIIWEIEGVRRVLDPTIQRPDQVLLLLYSSTDWVDEDDLRSWVEYKNKTHFRNLVLMPLHADRMVEFQRSNGRVKITPRGAKQVEDNILPRSAS